MFLAQSLVIFACFSIKLRFEFFVQQRIHHAHRARCIEHVHSAGAIMRRDLHRGVRPACGRAANQQRQTKSFALHFLCHMDHFIQ